MRVVIIETYNFNDKHVKYVKISVINVEFNGMNLINVFLGHREEVEPSDLYINYYRF